MEEVLEYLQMKNHYYEKFCSITEKFLEQARRSQWDDIEFFVDNRERLLSIIRSFDYKIARVFQETAVDDSLLEKYRLRVKSLLDQRNELGKRIVALDLELISRMDEMKSETIRDLKKTIETRDSLDSFSRVSNPRKTTRTKDV